MFAKKSQKELEEIARNLVNKVIANILFEHDKIRNAVDKTNQTDWQQTMAEISEEVMEMLMDLFGTSD